MVSTVAYSPVQLPDGTVISGEQYAAMQAANQGAPAPRSALGEIATGAQRGLAVSLPQMTGQALKAFGAPATGQSLVEGAQRRAADPYYMANPEDHNPVTNALASGADMLGAAAPILASQFIPVVGQSVAALAGGALFGGSTYQDVYEKAKASGASDSDAQIAGLKAGAVMGIGGAVAPGIVKGAFAPLAAGAEGFAAPAAQAAKGLLMPAATRVATTTAELAGVNAAQSAGVRSIEQGVGIEGESPLDAALGSLPASLGMSAFLGPFAAFHVRSQQVKLTGAMDRINDLSATPDARIDAINTVAPLIAAAPPRGSDAKAWNTLTNQWRLDAMAAAAKGDTIDLSPTFSSEWGGKQIAIQKATAQATGTDQPLQPALPAPPKMLALPPPTVEPLGPLPRGPEMAHREVPGETPIPMGRTRTPEEVIGDELAAKFPQPAAAEKPFSLDLPSSEADLARDLDALGEKDRAKAAAAKDVSDQGEVAGLHDQVKQGLTDAGLTPIEPKSLQQFAKDFRKLPDVTDTSQAAIKSAYAEHVRDVMRQNADALEAHENKSPEAKTAEQLAAQEPPAPKTAEQVARERAAEPVTNNQLGQKLAHELGRQQADRTKQVELDEIARVGEHQRQLERDAAPADGQGYNAQHLNTLFDEHTQANDLGLTGQSRAKAKMVLDAAAKKPKLADQIAELVAQREKISNKAIATRDALDSFINHLKGDSRELPNEEGRSAAQGVRASEDGRQGAAAGARKEPNGSTQAAGDRAGSEGTTKQSVRSAEDRKPGAGAEGSARKSDGAGKDGSKSEPEPVRAEVAEHPATTRSQETRDALDATVADFTERVRKGEKLSDLERERLEDAQALRKTIGETIKRLETLGDTPENQPRNRQRQDNDETYLDDLLALAKETQKPYSESHRFGGDAKDVDPRVMTALMRNTTVKGLLEDLSTMSQTPWVKALAKRLLAQGVDGTLSYGPKPPGTVLGKYHPASNTVHVYHGGESEHVVMHELTHAATAKAITEAAGIGKPKTQRQVELKRAYHALEAIRQELLAKYPDQADAYGLKNAHEFVAELNTNKAFQDQLRGDPSLWTRILRAIDGLLGTRLADRSHLDKALDLQNAFFDSHAAEGLSGDDVFHAFGESPAKGAKALDGAISGVFDRVASVMPKGSLGTTKKVLFDAALYGSSKRHIVDMTQRVQALKGKFAEQVERIPVLDKKTQQVQQHAAAEPSKFAMGLERRLSKLDAATRTTVEGEMGTIGKTASAFNVDPRKSFADNLKANPKLDPKQKAIIDELHKRFTNFAAAHPEFTKDIKTGEQLGRKAFVNQMAGLARNVLHMTSGDMAARDKRVVDAGDALRDAIAKNEGVKKAQAELDEAKQALAHAKENASALTKHDVGLDLLDPKLAEAGAKRYTDALAAAKTPEAKAAVKSIRDMHVDDAAYEMHQRVEGLFADAAKLGEGNPLKGALAAVSKGYHSQIDNPYMHLGRQGTYFVRGGAKDLTSQEKAKVDAVFAKHGLVAADLGRTQDHAFAKFETQEEASAFHNDLQKALGPKFTDPQTGKLSENYALDNKGGVNVAMRNLSDGLNKTFGDVEGLTSGQRQQIKDAFTQQLISMLPETSSAKATMQRKGTPGYSAEYVRSFAKRASEIARQTGTGYTVRDYTDAFRQMREATDDLSRTDPDGQRKATQISDELGTRHANDMKPASSDIVSAINGFGFSYYLGASPAFVIRNAMQTWHLGLPALGGKFGFVKSAKALSAASVDSYKILKSTIQQGLAGKNWREVLDVGLKLDGLGLSKGEQDMLHTMVESGVINAGQTNQINELMGPTGKHGLRDAVRAAGLFADYSEKANRLTMGLAAYRLAGGEANHAAATKYAMAQVEATMINYESHNTARALGTHAAVTGAATPLFSQFAKYNFGVLEMVHNLMHDAIGQQHDGTPAGIAAAKQAQAEAMKTMAGLAATTTMLAGVMGLPFVSAFAGLYNMLASDKDDPQDVRIQVQAFLAKTFGKTVGEMISHGAPRAAGVDFGTIGLQDILPGSGMLADRAQLKDRIADQSQEMLGPAINGGANVALGLAKMSDGYYLKGLEQMLPTALKNLAKSYDTAQHGFTDSKGNPIVTKAGPIDPVIQAFGLRPAAKAVSDEVNVAAGADRDLREHRKDVITDHLYKAYTSKDAGEIASWESQRAAYNAKNPTEPIRKIDAFRQNAKGMAIGSQFGVPLKLTGKQTPKADRYAIGNIGT